MEPITKFMELKRKVIDEFNRILYCDVKVEETPTSYEISCLYSNVYSYIRFDKSDLTRSIIAIITNNYHYYNNVRIPSMKLAKSYLSLLYRARGFDDYLSLIDDLMNFRSELENVVEVLYAAGRFILLRAISNNGDITLKLDHLGEDKITRHLILITRPWRTLITITFENFDEIKSTEIPMKDVPNAYRSIINYAMKVSSLTDFTRLNMAVSELVRLVKVEKRDIRDAIKELVEVHGYHDVFGS